MKTPFGQLTHTVHRDFARFVNDAVLPLTSLEKDKFWQDFAKLIDDFSPVNRELLAKRDDLQQQIDQWHKQHISKPFSTRAYKTFLASIGYLEEQGEDFIIETTQVDDEIAKIAGPQLVVPLKNARFALNAANARWGSLYDALYGSDVIPTASKPAAIEGYSATRGKRVVEYAKQWLDATFPLQRGSHQDVSAYLIYFNNLLAFFSDGQSSGLMDNSQFVASNGPKDNPETLLFKNNGLHVAIHINRSGRIGSQDRAGIDNIEAEAALTTIMDCEDSVAAVDTEDKLIVYRNWLGLIEGHLQACFKKNGRKLIRALNPDKHFTALDGTPYDLHGRSLLLIRNVGSHMHTDLIKDSDNNPVPEGIVDTVITSLIASLDLKKNRRMPNSPQGSIYIVKPKLHGPHEVAFTCKLFGRVENILGLPENTLKIGIMDEERRTSLNLKACIRAAKKRIAFINTGFLDRTGDEIHTSMYAGAFAPKAILKEQGWFTAYENNNVDIGLACGLQNKAQIGKGMWAMPDKMRRMVTEKINHPLAGANTAWVPSPTAATLHAMHYHKVNVLEIQEKLKLRQASNRDDMLSIPLLGNNCNLTIEDIKRELENNIQGILGYVVHWINQGTGCSKIPDINNTNLMEDRATLRISSQHIANWLYHGVCHRKQVETTMEKMALAVDEQNKDNPDYQPMTTNLYENPAFKAARELIFGGIKQANGYTEAILHRYRMAAKKKQYEVQQLTQRPEEHYLQTQATS